MTLEILICNGGFNFKVDLPQIYTKFDPDTIQHAIEITNDRRNLQDLTKREELRKTMFWTADSALYRVEDGEVVLYFGNIETNFIFKNIKKAIKPLLKKGNYIPKRREIQTVMDSVDSNKTIRIKLSDLNLRNISDEFSCFKIKFLNYDNLNKVQRELAERIYGQGNDFKENMNMFATAGLGSEMYEGLDETNIHVLNPAYVKKNVSRNGAIARLCLLDEFDYDSRFDADNHHVDHYGPALRGILKK